MHVKLSPKDLNPDPYPHISPLFYAFKKEEFD